MQTTTPSPQSSPASGRGGNGENQFSQLALNLPNPLAARESLFTDHGIALTTTLWEAPLLSFRTPGLIAELHKAVQTALLLDHADHVRIELYTPNTNQHFKTLPLAICLKQVFRHPNQIKNRHKPSKDKT